jgi:hypothetical protein
MLYKKYTHLKKEILKERGRRDKGDFEEKTKRMENVSAFFFLLQHCQEPSMSFIDRTLYKGMIKCKLTNRVLLFQLLYA